MYITFQKSGVNLFVFFGIDTMLLFSEDFCNVTKILLNFLFNKESWGGGGQLFSKCIINKNQNNLLEWFLQDHVTL